MPPKKIIAEIEALKSSEKYGIDLTKLKVGDTVILRFGGRIVVDRFGITKYGTVKIGGATWWNNGCYEEPSSPFDIIDIEPRPKPREIIEYMAFYWWSGFCSAATLEDCKAYYTAADKYFKITITEGEEPKIEEVK